MRADSGEILRELRLRYKQSETPEADAGYRRLARTLLAASSSGIDAGAVLLRCRGKTLGALPGDGPGAPWKLVWVGEKGPGLPLPVLFKDGQLQIGFVGSQLRLSDLDGDLVLSDWARAVDVELRYLNRPL
jgi:hypothetical protein